MQERIDIKEEGDNVVMSINGRAIILPWEAAIRVADGLKAKAKLAERHAKMEILIADASFLKNAGAPGIIHKSIVGVPNISNLKNLGVKNNG